MTDTTPTYATREQWLQAAVEAVTPLFEQIDVHLPEVRVSCGWPVTGGASRSKRKVGECWQAEASSDGINQIFVSPWLDKAIEVDDDGHGHGVMETLIHELCHAADDGESGHKGAFRRTALDIGLGGKMTATHMGEELVAKVAGIVEELGPYPHAKLDHTSRKKQSTRMKKVECPGCGYVVRTTRKWLEMGVPTCACGEEMEPEQGWDQ